MLSYIDCGQFPTMDHNPFWLQAPQPGSFGNRDMYSRRIHIRDPVDCQCCFVRQSDLFGSLTRAGPQYCFPVGACVPVLMSCFR
jgi:hypothetical protein